MMGSCKSGIYEIVNTVSDKRYIGSAIDLNKRWRAHKSELKKGYHDSQYLQNAYNKYGKDNFMFNVVEHVNDINNLIWKEQEWIDKYDFEIELYNICKVAGSTLGKTVSLETKKKMSKRWEGSGNPKYIKLQNEVVNQIIELYVNEKNALLVIGKKFGISTGTVVRRLIENNVYIRNISESCKGKKLTKWHKKRISDGVKGLFVGEKHPMFGKYGEKNPNYRRYNENEKKIILDNYAKGVGVKYIYKKVKTSHKKVKEFLIEQGIKLRTKEETILLREQLNIA